MADEKQPLFAREVKEAAEEDELVSEFKAGNRYLAVPPEMAGCSFGPDMNAIQAEKPEVNGDDFPLTPGSSEGTGLE
ncbi:hypothetical protein VCB98_02445 [Gammaproteobacteria bacterium AB-CW1]|uniref:Uncharacterized protein n=1 Tax=Natronospira elongata TaxID=3110268 RepID=A0AAP6MLK1_9GAMM|nr:hypothetical protein [Gammaproteobacteria bacterium AB-CW1]